MNISVIKTSSDDFDIKQTLQIISHTILLTDSNET